MREIVRRCIGETHDGVGDGALPQGDGLLDLLLLEIHLPSSNLPYLFAAFAVSWVVLFGYLFYVNRRQHEMRKEITRLQNLLEQTEDEE